MLRTPDLNVSHSRPPLPNSDEAITERVRSGQVTWKLVVVVSFARLFFAVAAQGITALVLALHGTERPFQSAAAWFTVHGTLVDVATLLLLSACLRREGMTVLDLFRGAPTRLLRSLLQVPLVLIPMVAAGVAAAALLGIVLLGTPFPPPPISQLPLWAGIYSTLVWPLVWGFVEQATYDGYAAPRAYALTRSAWAPAVVCLGFAAQHLALPLRFDAVFLSLRFFPALAVGVVMVAIYLRTRNLLPLAIAHWLVDAMTGALTLPPLAP